MTGVLAHDTDVLAELGRLAEAHDRADDGAFPDACFALLERAGIAPATATRMDAGRELELVRRVAGADVSVGRILDGHYNAVQRLGIHVDRPLVRAELDAVLAGELRLGVWGADPAPGEGEPAHVVGPVEDRRLSGVKIFCSGAGGVHRAFVVVRGGPDATPGWLAYVDTTEAIEVDRDWFAGAGMRGSASHRVVFHDARVLWLADGPGTLLQEPWFSGDAIRTAASWAGGADAVVGAAIALLRAKGATGDLEALAVGRLLTAQQTIDLWIAHAGREIEAGTPDPRALAAHLRDAVTVAVGTILDEAARACGSRPFAVGGAIERARRDLQTYVLQHRLDPIVARAGREALDR